jgi:spore coat polysaccharide biosynthesis protein SpsF
MKITAIIQARMDSTRLPGKVTEIISGRPMLWHIINRVKQAKLVNEIIIATTTKEVDEQIAKVSKDSGVKSFAGSENDVLDRFYQAVKKYNADAIVRITADCPVVDPRIMDKVIERYMKGDCDYAANVLKRTYPDGLDLEVFSFISLEKAWNEAKLASEREHVTPYILKNPDKFKIAIVENKVNLSDLRWSVDEKADLDLVRQIYKHLYKEGHIFYMEDILELLERHPELKQINEGIVINEGYAKSLKEDKIVKLNEGQFE